MTGLTWQQGGADILWSGGGFLFVAMAACLIGHWRRDRERDARQQRRERDLPRLARAVGAVERRTEQLPLGDLVVSPAQEQYAQWLHERLRRTSADLTEVIEVYPRGGCGLGDVDPDPGLGGWR